MNAKPANRKLTKKQLEHFRKKLMLEKNKVLEEMTDLQQNNLKQSISDASGENSRYTYHLGDVASLSYGREFSMGLAERQQKYLEEIDEAIGRIEEGTYGICKVTGEPISIERLEEVPVAKYSVKGKGTARTQETSGRRLSSAAAVGEARPIRNLVFLCLSICSVFAPCCSSEASEARFEISDTALLSFQCPRSLLSRENLDRFISLHRGRELIHFVHNYLDSLGFFDSRTDTSLPHQYVVRPGKRAVIAAETAPRIDTLSVDSIPPFACPRPYDAGEVSARVASIGRRLAEKGFPFATVGVTITPFPVPPKGNVGRFDSLLIGYRIMTDRKCLFADPLLIGAKSTRHSLLLHDAAMKTGDPFDIRKVEATLDALSRRPYITDATLGKIAVQPNAPPGLHDTMQSRDHDYVAVPIYLKDRTGLGIDGALGLSSIAGSPAIVQGNMTLSFFNLFHAGESASLLYAGDKTYQKFNIEAAKPWLFDYPMTASGSFGLEVKNNEYGYLAAQATDLIDIQNGWNVGFSLKATETTEDSVVGSDTMTGTWRYYGVNFLLGRTGQPLKDGVLSTELSLAVGGGVAERERDYSRSNVEFTAGIHAPLASHQALHLRLVTENITTAESTLVSAEMYRVGGYGSVRGYLDNEFAFRTVAYDQLEYLYYFTATGSAYIFCDNGFGFSQPLTAVRWGEETGFLGYGIGVRLPAKFGIVTLEWARNKDDGNSLGRLHVGASNE